MESHEHKLRALTSGRWRIAFILTTLMIVIYFGFMLTISFAKEWLGTEIVPGLSWGILLGALVIVLAWLLTFIYVRWANLHYDPHVILYREDRSQSVREGKTP